MKNLQKNTSWRKQFGRHMAAGDLPQAAQVLQDQIDLLGSHGTTPNARNNMSKRVQAFANAVGTRVGQAILSDGRRGLTPQQKDALSNDLHAANTLSATCAVQSARSQVFATPVAQLRVSAAHEKIMQAQMRALKNLKI